MILVRSSFGTTMRLLMAVLLLLAGLAGARLQGHLGGGAALAATTSLLCSGQPNPVDDGSAQHAAHDHCILCHAPLGAACDLPALTAQVPMSFHYGMEEGRLAPVFTLRPVYQSRAPPVFST